MPNGQKQNGAMPMLGRFSEIVLSPLLARGLLALAILEALASPFAGPKWAAYAIATGIASLGVTSQLSSISLSWCWFHLAGLRGQVEQRNEEVRQPKVVVQ